jgi:V/A-type H+-transporting ATPase subunit I
MGVKSLVKVILVAPKVESDAVFKKLAAFNWFDPEEAKSYRQRYELAEEAKALRDQLDSLANSLSLKEEPGVIEVLTKGYNVRKEKLEAEDWREYISKVREEAQPMLEEAGRLKEEMDRVQRRMEDVESQRGLLEFVATFRTNPNIASEITRLHVRLAIIKSKDVKELAKSLPKVAVFSQPITKKDSVVLTVGSREDGQRIERALKSFDARQVSVPKEMADRPAEAYRRATEEMGKLKEERVRLSGLWERFRQEKGERVLFLREASQVACDVLSHGSANPFNRFLKVSGYVPRQKLQELKDALGDAIVLVEEEAHDGVPTLVSNPKYVDSFEEITFTQGPPSPGDIDPTPLISVVFPVFYGMMFADAGQGLLMLLLGLAIWKRAAGRLKKWGMAICSFGAAATVVGLLTGEVFGFATEALPLIGGELRRLVLIDLEPLKEGQGIGIFMLLLVFAIMVGIAHITIGLSLDTVKSWKKGERVEVLVNKLPTLLFYAGGVIFALAFVGNGFTFDGIMASTSFTPILGLPVGMVSSMVLPLIFVVVSIIALGRAMAVKLGKLQGEGSFAILVVDGIVEVLLKIVEFMANSISYARLGILLVVHVSLMVVVNKAMALGLAGLPIVIFGNVGVMMLEGLIVYIQDLRLHLYEWFTKFYEGGGKAFRTMVPYTRRVELSWKA